MNKKIMFRFGHEYLFWSAGYYNVMELVGHFDIVLLVPCTYRMSNRFLAFLEENPCVYCVYSPELNGQSICSHQRFFRHSKDVIKDHKPDILVQNDYIELENMYLHAASKTLTKPILNIVQTLSRSSSPNTVSLLTEKKLDGIRSVIKSSYLSKIALSVIEVARFLESHLINVVYPCLFCGVRSYLKGNTILNIDTIPKFTAFDSLISNEDYEVAYIQNLLSPIGADRSGPHKLDSAISAPRGYAAILATY